MMECAKTYSILSLMPIETERLRDTQSAPDWTPKHASLLLRVENMAHQMESGPTRLRDVKSVIAAVTTYYTDGLSIELDHPRGLLEELRKEHEISWRGDHYLYPDAVYTPLMTSYFTASAYHDMVGMMTADGQLFSRALASQAAARQAHVETTGTNAHQDVLLKIHKSPRYFQQDGPAEPHIDGWEIFRSSPRARMLFGAGIDEMDDKLFRYTLASARDPMDFRDGYVNLGRFPRPEAAEALLTAAQSMPENDWIRTQYVEKGLRLLSSPNIPDSLGIYAEVARRAGIRDLSFAQAPELLDPYLRAVFDESDFRGTARTSDPSLISGAAERMRASENGLMTWVTLNALKPSSLRK